MFNTGKINTNMCGLAVGMRGMPCCCMEKWKCFSAVRYAPGMRMCR